VRIGTVVSASAGPERIAQAVADGEAELASQVTSLLLVRGVELVGKIPPELQNYLVFEAGVGAAASEPEAAKALIKHLMSPEAVPVIKAKGWEPALDEGQPCAVGATSDLGQTEKNSM